MGAHPSKELPDYEMKAKDVFEICRKSLKGATDDIEARLTEHKSLTIPYPSSLSSGTKVELESLLKQQTNTLEDEILLNRMIIFIKTYY